MPQDIKPIFTILIALVLVGVLGIHSNANNAGPKWFWRGGSDNLVHRMLFCGDGSLNKYAKLAMVACLLLFLAALWLLVPSSS